MENAELFENNLELATQTRIHIQDDLRFKYNVLKKIFQKVTGDEGKVLKHLVDMYHYRNGGYPNENSEPKHKVLLDNFIYFVKYFQLIGLEKRFITDYLSEYGITITIDDSTKLQNVVISKEDFDFIQSTLVNEGVDLPLTRVLKIPGLTTKRFLKTVLLICDQLQGEICSNSNYIRKELAPEVEENCEIKKGDFTSGVNFNVRKKKNKVTEKNDESENKSFSSKTIIHKEKLKDL